MLESVDQFRELANMIHVTIEDAGKRPRICSLLIISRHFTE